MKSGRETLGERIRRIRGEMHQSSFGERLGGASQATVSAWERNDKDRLPSADMLFRLATLATQPEDQIFFLRQAGLGRQLILSAAERIFSESIIAPVEGEILRVPIVRRTERGNEETGELYPISARQVQHPASTVCLLVDDVSATSLVSSGTVVVLDTSNDNSPDLRPFWDEMVLLDIDAEHPHGHMYQAAHDSWWPHGLSIGRLRCEKADDPVPSGRHFLVWHAVFGVLTDLEVRRMIVGHWSPDHPSAYRSGTKEEIEKLEKELEREAPGEIRLEQRCKIVGRVLGLFLGSPPTQRVEK